MRVNHYGSVPYVLEQWRKCNSYFLALCGGSRNVVFGFLLVWFLGWCLILCWNCYLVWRDGLAKEEMWRFLFQVKAMRRFGKLFHYVYCGTSGDNEMLDYLRGKSCTSWKCSFDFLKTIWIDLDFDFLFFIFLMRTFYSSLIQFSLILIVFKVNFSFYFCFGFSFIYFLCVRVALLLRSFF